MRGGARGQPSPLRALAILGSASGLTIIAGILSQKAAAVLLEPAGVGEMGVVIAFTGVVGVIAALSANSALVALIGQEGQSERGMSTSGLVRSARQNTMLAGAVLVSLAMLTAPWVGDAVLGNGTSVLEFGMATAAGALWALNTVEIGILVAHHRVRATARAAALTCFISPVVNVVLFLLLDRQGIIPASILSIFLVFLVTRAVVAHEVPDLGAAAAEGRRALIRFGVPITVSSFVGASVVLALPILTTHVLGEEGTGYYRAAAVIAEGYLVMITTTISQDFFPRVARVATVPAELSAVTATHLRLVAMVFAPVALTIGALLPLLVPLLYSSDFAPAEQLIRLQLSGDLLRLLGSVLATALLAALGSGARLATEVVAALLYIGMSAAGLLVGDLRGLGIAFSAFYLLYVLGLGFVLRRAGGLRLPVSLMTMCLGLVGLLTLPAMVAELVSVKASSIVAGGCALATAGPLATGLISRLRHR